MSGAVTLAVMALRAALIAQVAAAALVFAAGCRSGPDERPRWRGGFETGDLSQWDSVQRAAPDRIRVVRDPVTEGRRAARFEVRPGDSLPGTGTEDLRAEVATLRRRDPRGSERWYRWFTWFDKGFPTGDPDSFVTFTQFKKDGEGGGPVSFMVWGDQVQLRTDEIHWSARLEPRRWHEFLFHVRWSPDPNVGFVELWYDGEHVVPRTKADTMHHDEQGRVLDNYLKQGLYQAAGLPAAVVFHDGMAAGDSRAAVTGE